MVGAASDRIPQTAHQGLLSVVPKTNPPRRLLTQRGERRLLVNG
ncbi:hypothetical protein Rcae01_06343 [Novipirellula caenicola]|uniref:Uncharacterized protein n=1 Tax=Novipirellula caenicola TaxID=1536901 RepID=A0ABP9W4H6_9BACT